MKRIRLALGFAAALVVFVGGAVAYHQQTNQPTTVTTVASDGPGPACPPICAPPPGPTDPGGHRK